LEIAFWKVESENFFKESFISYNYLVYYYLFF
jgi:hypothetical protein